MSTAPIVIRATDWKAVPLDPEPDGPRWGWDVECREHEWWYESGYEEWRAAVETAHFHLLSYHDRGDA